MSEKIDKKVLEYIGRAKDIFRTSLGYGHRKDFYNDRESLTSIIEIAKILQAEEEKENININLILAKVKLVSLKSQNGGYDFYAHLPKDDQTEVLDLITQINEKIKDLNYERR